MLLKQDKYVKKELFYKFSEPQSFRL